MLDNQHNLEERHSLLARLIVFIHLYARGLPTSAASAPSCIWAGETNNRRDNTFPLQLDVTSLGPARSQDYHNCRL